MIITIDGPVATGKSAVAKKLAESIGYIFFDTGAMYRTVTYGILKYHIDIQQADELQQFLDQFPSKFDIKIVNREKKYFFENEEVTQLIRHADVTQIVSEVSAYKSVREKLIALQRELAVGVNAVFEGRDMGTVAFPDASLKIFLTGRNEIRAKRRFDELKTKYPQDFQSLTLEQCLEDINKRDAYDTQREHSPLIQAQDAYVIDTSDWTIEEVVSLILEYKDSIKDNPHSPNESYS